MPPLQQHIEDSLEKFEKRFAICYADREPELDYKEVGEVIDFLKQSQLELLEVLKGEIEKLERYEAFGTYTGAGCFEDKNGDYLYRQDVLDLLKN